MKFISDILSEESGGKYSSKKIWGHIFMFLVGTSFILDGLGKYKANVELFNAMLIAGTTLLGLKVIKDLFSKKNGTESK